MFIPLGDNLNKRMIPIAGIFLIAVNWLAFCYTCRLWNESVPKRVTYYEVDGEIVLDPSVKTSMDHSPYVKFYDLWGLVPRDLARGNIFSLLTYQFLHAGFFHLLGNMLMFWALVGSLENLIGAQRFVVYYLIWGVCGGLAHALANWGDATPMVGASGAIAGVIGAYFVTFGALSKIRIWTWFGVPLRFSVPASVFVVIWGADQLLGLSDDVESGASGIAWFAHAGGFAAGALTMYLFGHRNQRRLVMGKGGVLEFHDVEQPRPAAESAEDGGVVVIAPEPEPPAPVCTYCGASLADENRIHDRLYRCPAAECARLVMLPGPAAPPRPATRVAEAEPLPTHAE
jgi:membrane associated rhomboid family serine protease